MKTYAYTNPAPTDPAAYLANGVIGLRVPQIPFLADTAFVQGYVGVGPEDGVEEMLPIPYPLGCDLAIGGCWLSQHPHQAEFVEQRYDFSCAELTSVFRVKASAATAEVEVLTVCSRTQPMVVLQRTTVYVDKPCELVLQAKIDWRGAMGALQQRVMAGRPDQPRPGRDRDAIVHWQSPGGLSTVGLAYDSILASDDLQSRRRNDYGHERDLALTNYSLAAKPGADYSMDQIAAAVPCLMHGQPHWQAARMVVNAGWRGFDELRADNQVAWAELWKGRPVFAGAAERWQEISDSCFFYTHSSIHPSSLTGIAPFGLADRNYKGHVFWDYESFMLPAVALTAPDAARASMDYRGRCREMAAQNARMHGYRGIQFPWQSGNHGEEVTSYYNSAREFHINPAVAVAVGQYLHATNDRLFRRETGWPILKGVAEWITSFVTRTKRGYETLHLASPNETYHDVNNDIQMHLFSKVALREAIWCAGELGEPAPAVWQEIADNLFMPTDPDEGALVQFEDFPLKTDSRASVGPMWGLFPLGVSCGEKIDRATQKFFHKSMSSYYGMPMSSSYCAVWAAMMGDRDEALQALEAGIADRVIDPFMQIVEAAPKLSNQPWLTNVTNFVTGQGGFLTAALLGFAGLQLGPGDAASWCRRAPALPTGWNALEVERVWVHGEPMRLTARHGDTKAELESI